VLGDRHVWERARESQRLEGPGAAVGDARTPVASRLLVTRALYKDDQKLLALMTKMEFYRDELPDGVEEALWQRGMVEDR
jgi:hypothetical protein